MPEKGDEPPIRGRDTDKIDQQLTLQTFLMGRRSHSCFCDRDQEGGKRATPLQYTHSLSIRNEKSDIVQGFESRQVEHLIIEQGRKANPRSAID
jgi:hypothetical protein